jgi:hypothetical protein
MAILIGQYYLSLRISRTVSTWVHDGLCRFGGAKISHQNYGGTGDRLLAAVQRCAEGPKRSSMGCNTCVGFQSFSYRLDGPRTLDGHKPRRRKRLYSDFASE